VGHRVALDGCEKPPHTGIRSPGHPARTVVAIPNTLPRLTGHQCTYDLFREPKYSMFRIYPVGRTVRVSFSLLCFLVLLEAVCTRFLSCVVFPCVVRGLAIN
jgi:hypothetical protein